jgi:glycosyltransferase involved in cell wall biosynthesis
MPGQFRYLSQALANDPKHKVVFVTKRDDCNIKNVHKVVYKTEEKGSSVTHNYLKYTQASILQGQEVWRVCRELKKEGFTPDVVIAHPGWGDALYIKDIYENVPVLSYFEYYYHGHGHDINFDPEYSQVRDANPWALVRNTTNIFNLINADWGISPTFWQRDIHPEKFHNKISVIHDGVDTDMICPTEGAEITLTNGTKLNQDSEVITYIARSLEPCRGFHTFMRSLERIQKARPNAHVLVIGGDDVTYGDSLPGGVTFRQLLLSEVNVDLNRVHFFGRIPYPQLMAMLRISTAHIYLTYPFILSWSMLEAMATECVIVGSNTGPVKEIIKDGSNGFLVDFFSPEELASKVIEVIKRRDELDHVRKTARETIKARYDLKYILPLQIELIEALASGGVPSSVAQKIADFSGDDSTIFSGSENSDMLKVASA